MQNTTAKRKIRFRKCTLFCLALYHLAPELLECCNTTGDIWKRIIGGSPQGDIFSFGIVMYQILFRMEPYENDEDIQPGGMTQDECVHTIPIWQ